jgi:hypothetical protein
LGDGDVNLAEDCSVCMSDASWMCLSVSLKRSELYNWPSLVMVITSSMNLNAVPSRISSVKFDDSNIVINHTCMSCEHDSGPHIFKQPFTAKESVADVRCGSGIHATKDIVKNDYLISRIHCTCKSLVQICQSCPSG